MTLGPEPVEFESRLDALGRAMETAAATPAPEEFVGAVRRRRRWIAVRRVGAGACGALTLVVVVAAAQHRGEAKPDGGSRVASAPTFRSLHKVEDVDAAPRLTNQVMSVAPMARAGDRPDSEVARELAEFK